MTVRLSVHLAVYFGLSNPKAEMGETKAGRMLKFLHSFAENLLALWTESMPRNHRNLATPRAPSRATCLSPTRLVELPSESRRFHCFSSCPRQFASPSVTPFLGPGIALRFFASLAYFHLS